MHKGESETQSELLDSIDEALYALDQGARFIYVNRSAERIFGSPRRELIGRRFADAVPSLVRSALDQAQERVLAGGSPERIEDTLPAARLPIEASLYPSRFGISVHLRDIRARQSMESELRDRNATLELAERSAEIGIWDVDLKTELARGTPQFFRIMGLPPSSGPVPMNVIRAIRHPDDRDRVVAGFRDTIASGRDTYEMEYRIVRPSGEIRWIFGRGRVVRDASGTPVRYSGVDLDVTERKQSEAKLAESEERLRLAQEAAGIGTWDWDVQSGALRWSDTEWRLHGLEPDAAGLSFERWYATIHADDRDFVIRSADAAKQAASGGLDGAYRAEYRVPFPDGRVRWLVARGRAISVRDDAPIRLLGVTVDVTERRAAEEALARLNRDLEARVRQRTAELEAEAARRSEAESRLHQAQKMEAVGQLTGGVAHDFNNLLTVILGNLETLKRRAAEGSNNPPDLLRLADNAVQGAQRAVALTQHLLAFSRRQPLNPKPLNANRLVTGMSNLLRRTLGEAITIETVLAAGLWNVNADANQLESAILNLAVNARDAMPNGGNLTIETANTHLDEGYAARHTEVVPGQYAAIAVTDTGSGMSADVVARAFEPFFTTKEVGRGTGLGLSQVYGFVKQSGGHVKIYSEPGQGTTVKLYLPRYFGAAEEAGEAMSLPAAGLRARAETIIVVDDDEGVRAHSVEILAELGYTVLPAADGPRALALLEANPQTQLLFTDVGLPGGMNGRALADAARERRPDLKVLFTTGYARNAIFHDGRLDPGIQLLTKPFTYAALGAKVRELLDSGPRPILVVEDEALLRMFIVEALQEMGLRTEEAGTAREALNKMRVGGGAIRAAIIDLGLPDCRDGRLAAELRSLDAQLPIVIASGYPAPEIRRQFRDDKRIDFLNKPYQRERLEQVLQALGIVRR